MSDRLGTKRVRRFHQYPAYRDSRVDWLGEIPCHWSLTRLKNLVARLVSGGTPESDNLRYWTDEDHGIPWVAISDMTRNFRLEVTAKRITEEGRWSKRLRILPAGTLLYSIYGSLGRVAVLETEAVTNQAILGVVPRESEVLGDYLRWWFDFMQAHVEKLSSSNTQDNLSADRVRNMPIVLPIAIEEQQSIANFLDRETAMIDGLVARKARLIELLQEKRTALITRAVTRGLDSNVPMKDSGVEWLGEIPAHWNLKPLKHVSPEITVGVVVNPSKYVREEGVPFLYGSDISEGRIVTDTVRRMSTQDSRRLSKSRLWAGDLVCVRVGAPGVTSVVPPQLSGANCASVLIVRQAGSFNSQWLCYAMNSRLVRFQVELVQYGAAQEQFNVAHAVGFVVPSGPLSEQRLIAEFLDRETARIDALIAKTRQAIDLLNEFRTTLISAAVTGKIDVREAVPR